MEYPSRTGDADGLSRGDPCGAARALRQGIDIWLEPEARRYSISGRVFWPDGLSPENVVIEYLLGEYTLSASGLPPEWRVRRITRGGAALSGNRISVLPGERVTDIEVIVGNGP